MVCKRLTPLVTNNACPCDPSACRREERVARVLPPLEGATVARARKATHCRASLPEACDRRQDSPPRRLATQVTQDLGPNARSGTRPVHLLGWICADPLPTAPSAGGWGRVPGSTERCGWKAGRLRWVCAREKGLSISYPKPSGLCSNAMQPKPRFSLVSIGYQWRS